MSRRNVEATPAAKRRDVPPRLDAANLAGITTLMNTQHLKGGVDLGVAEKAVMGRSATPNRRAETVDPVQVYENELNRLAEELGIDLLDGSKPARTAPVAARTAPAPASVRTAAAPLPRATLSSPTDISGLVDTIDFSTGASSKPGPAFAAAGTGLATGQNRSRDGQARGAYGSQTRDRRSRGRHSPSESSATASDGSSYSDSGSYSESGSSQSDSGQSDSGSDGSDSGSYSGSDSGCDCDDESSCDDDCSCACHEASSSTSVATMDDDVVDDIISRLEADIGIKTDGKRDRHRRRLRNAQVPHVERRVKADTDEQERRRHINSVVEDLRGETRTTYGVERERMRDVKASKLEQIGQLLMGLREEGIDCEGVTVPSSDSPMDEIDSVLDILRLKNDRNRYSSLAEEVILGGAEAIETVFDGTRRIPMLGWTPDYTGYHNTVNVKLHRMRGETSRVVGNIIEKYNIGPTTRILMELLPSFFLYPRQQKKQRAVPGLASDPHITDARRAYNAIRDADSRKNFDAVNGI